MPTKRSNVKELLFLITISLVWFGLGWLANGFIQAQEASMVDVALLKLQNHLDADQVPATVLEAQAIRGALDTLDDRYSSLLIPEAARRYLQDFEGDVGVMGLSAEIRNDQLVVNKIIAGDPADLAGVRVGDIFLQIDGININRRTSELDAALLVRGSLDQPAEFVMQRGEETLTFSIPRKPIVIVEHELLDQDIAYIAQHSFRTQSVELMREALETMLQENLNGIVWDLRGNGGGSMETAQEILSLFIEEGVLFSAELANGEQRIFEANGNALAAGVPLVILTDEQTRSAAETAAIAISSAGAGTIIGTTTNGKGTIQTTEPLPNGYFLQYTIGKWLDSDGNWYHEIGVPPDIEVADDATTEADEVMEAAIDYLLQAP